MSKPTNPGTITFLGADGIVISLPSFLFFADNSSSKSKSVSPAAVISPAAASSAKPTTGHDRV